MAFGDSIYLVKNEDDKPLDFCYNQQSITILPGTTAMVPFEAIVEKMGDPRSGPQAQPIKVNGHVAGYVASREWWINRLSTSYGIYDSSAISDIKAVMPKISVRTIDGEDAKFSFPIDDPESKYLMPDNTGGATVEENLRRELEEMKRRQRSIETLLKDRQIPEGIESIPEDNPEGNPSTPAFLAAKQPRGAVK